MKAFSWIIVCFLSCVHVFGQSSYVQKGHPAYDIYDRLSSKVPGNTNFHSALKHYNRHALMRFVNEIAIDSSNLTPLDLEDLDYLLLDNLHYSNRDYQKRETKETGFFRHFYTDNSSLFQIDQKDFRLKLNPILNIRLGKESQSSEPVFQNTRGIEFSGIIDDKIYFYSNIIENQANFYNYINRSIQNKQSIPGQAFYKDFESQVFDSFKGFDYLNGEAYIGFPISKHTGLELGHSNHFIGNGIRSLLLNDFSNNYFYVKFHLNVWKIHYQSLFTELAAVSANLNPDNKIIPKKYMATHFLNFKLSDRFEIGLFESVVFSRSSHFEFQYLNPVIFYRTVEQFLDSPDNVLIGINSSWIPTRNLSFYGQVIIDEFKLNEITSNEGWWGNKLGFQLGLKAFDLFKVDHLDLQIEGNLVRPFTYSHRDSLESFPDITVANYSHFGQPLAHPLGANFYETILRISYKPYKKLRVQFKSIFAKKGDNDLDENFGADILVPSGTRQRDYGFNLSSGIKKEIATVSLELNYQFFHNFFVDLNYLHRRSNSENDALDLNTNYFGMGIRMNVSNYKIDYE